MPIRYWKTLLLIPFGVLALTGCPESSKSTPQGLSQFTGAWVNSELDGIYTRHGQKPVDFCQMLARDYERYGIGNEGTQRTRIVVDAWLIDINGDVEMWCSLPALRETARNGAAHVAEGHHRAPCYGTG